MPEEEKEEMKFMVCLAVVLAVLLPGQSWGEQEVASGVVLDIEEKEIVVTGLRLERELPLPYESYLGDGQESLEIERVGAGRVYTFRRRLWEGNGLQLEYFRSWSDDGGLQGGAPEDRRSEGRVVFPFPLFGRGDRE